MNMIEILICLYSDFSPHPEIINRMHRITVNCIAASKQYLNHEVLFQ
jgi:hypothetical protein